MCEKMDALFQKTAPYAWVPVRLVLGIIFMAHGADKLFGTFGGGGFDATAAMFQNDLGLSPGWLHAALGGGTEFLGGLLVFLGLWTWVGGLLIVGPMLVAIFLVHLQGGLFAKDGGFEYPLLCLAAALSLLFSGGNKTLSLEGLLCKKSDD